MRTEARKVHDLFFDILKLAFPDMDFREARSAISFSAQVAASNSTPPSRQIHAGKRQKPVNDMGTDPSPHQKSLSRGPVLAGEDARPRSHMPRETRFGSNSSNNREVVQQEDSQPFTHPGELVICKKKRKDREKSGVKSVSGPGGPVSPVGVGRSTRNPGSGSTSRETRSSQQTSQQQVLANPAQQATGGGSGGGGPLGWANPVKRLRTDSGKRRPSHM